MKMKRMNFTVPEDVVKILKKCAKKGEKSNYIAEAVRAFAKKESEEAILRRMIEGYQATAAEDLELDSEMTTILNDGLDE